MQQPRADDSESLQCEDNIKWRAEWIIWFRAHARQLPNSISRYEYNLPRRAAAHANKRIITFPRYYSEDARRQENRSISPPFRIRGTRNIRSSVLALTSRSLSFSGRARWHVTLDVKHDPGTERCSGVGTYGSRRSCKAWDNVPRRYKSSLLTALFLIRALESRGRVFPFLRRREVVSVIGNYTTKFHGISYACRFRYINRYNVPSIRVNAWRIYFRHNGATYW